MLDLELIQGDVLLKVIPKPKSLIESKIERTDIPQTAEVVSTGTCHTNSQGHITGMVIQVGDIILMHPGMTGVPIVHGNTAYLLLNEREIRIRYKEDE